VKRSVLSLFAMGVLTSCAALGQTERDPTEQFGHRELESEGGRVTTVIEAADDTRAYRYADAFVDEVQVRPAPESAEPVAVEVLVKGAFPDACTELHEVSQVRSASLIDVNLKTRRPQNALCASVLRPYRFYLILEGTYAPGAYTLKLNGSVHAFEVHAATTKG